MSGLEPLPGLKASERLGCYSAVGPTQA